MNKNQSPNSNSATTQPLNPRVISLARLIYDFIAFIFSAYLILPALSQAPDIRIGLLIILGSVFGIFISTLVGYLLIRKGKPVEGLGFVVYGMIVGLFFVSLFVEGFGAFTFVTLVLLTTLSVSTSVPVRKMLTAISMSVLFGAAALFIDLNTGAALFRIPAPEILAPVLWVLTFVISAVFLILISRQFPYLPLRTKLGGSFVLVTVVALAILGFFNSRSVRSTLVEQANQALFAAASQTEDALLDFININLQSVSTEAHLPILIDYLSRPLNERRDTPLEDQVYDTLLALSGKDETFISSYALLDINGNNVVDTNLLDVGSSKSDRPYFQEPVATGEAYHSSLVISPTNGQPSIYFSSPVRTATNQIIGVLRVRFNGEVLQNLLERSEGLVGEDSFGVLFDEHFLHLAHGRAPETIFLPVLPLDPQIYEDLKTAGRIPGEPQEVNFEELAVLGENLTAAQNSEDGIVFFSALDIATGSRTNQVVAIDMQDPPWLLAFFQPQDIFLQPVENLANLTIVLSFAGAGGALFLAIALTQVLTTPLISLTESARRVTEGDLNTRVNVSTEDEIGELANAFNTMTAQLQNLVSSLESQVTERTRDLQNRAAQLQAAAEIARDSTSEVELDNLLSRAVNLISDRFNFYHVAIFFVDNRGQFAVLKEASLPLGEQLKQTSLRYPVNNQSNVGEVCFSGEPLIATTEDESSSVDHHILLQNTRAQLVLPLKVGGTIVGALDIHSSNPRAFRQDEIAIFQTMSDQLAIAIQKTEFREEIQETLDELETAYGLYTRESWRRFVQGEKTPSGYRYQQVEVEPVKVTPPEVVQAWKKGDTIVEEGGNLPTGSDAQSAISVPLKIRGEVIGVLNLGLEAERIPAETASLIQEIANRLSLVLENARLVESAQRRVERERLTTDITDKIRQSLDMDSVLKAAVQEIGQSLGLEEVEVVMGQVPMPESPDQSNGQTPQSDQVED